VTVWNIRVRDAIVPQGVEREKVFARQTMVNQGRKKTRKQPKNGWTKERKEETYVPQRIHQNPFSVLPTFCCVRFFLRLLLLLFVSSITWSSK
jgi:hypothetical protein